MTTTSSVRGFVNCLKAQKIFKSSPRQGTGKRRKSLIQQHKPDVAVLDIQMPKASGIEVTRWVRAHLPEVGVLILTAYDDDPYVMAVLQAGANGYVLKTAQADDLIQAVRDVNEGSPRSIPASRTN